MSPSTPNDEEFSRVLSAAIEMCQQQISQAQKRLREAVTPSEIYLARAESAEWALARTHLLAAQQLRGG